jgi:adenine phosphoribosyltransferase
MEARGFLFGMTLASEMGLPFVPLRKPGKLPRATVSVSYGKEYGDDALHMHTDAVGAGDRVLVVDDLIATGGTAQAAAKLIEQAGARVAALVFIVELVGLGGTEKLKDWPVYVVARCQDDEAPAAEGDKPAEA